MHYFKISCLFNRGDKNQWRLKGALSEENESSTGKISSLDNLDRSWLIYSMILENQFHTWFESDGEWSMREAGQHRLSKQWFALFWHGGVKSYTFINRQIWDWMVVKALCHLIYHTGWRVCHDALGPPTHIAGILLG